MSSVPAISPIRNTLPTALAIAAFYRRTSETTMTALLKRGPRSLFLTPYS